MLPLVDLDQQEIDVIVGTVPGGAANIQDIYPLAPLQEGILFHHLTAEHGDPYLLTFVMEFDTRARLEEYFTALQAVVARHDILRTSFIWEGLRSPVQVVWREAPLELIEVELDPTEGDIVEQLRARFDARRDGIDLGQAPLMRAYVAEDAMSGRWVVLRQQHHLVADHVSGEVLRAEIRAHMEGRDRALAEPIPFRNYVAEAIATARTGASETYFRELLHDVAEPTAPYGLLNVMGAGTAISESRQEVEPDLARRLRDRAKALGVSSASLCHVAWAQVLARVSDVRDVVFGTVIFGRMRGGEGADRAMGLFINTLPVRLLVGATSVADAVLRMHEQLADLMRHEHTSLAVAQRCSRIEAPTPLFASILNYRYAPHRPGEPTVPRDADGISTLSGEERSNYPLSLAVDDLHDRFSIRVKVESEVDARWVTSMMYRALTVLIEALETAPARPLGEVDVLPAEQRDQVMAWSATAHGSPSTRCVHELFEEQVSRTPDGVALVAGEQALSYRELERRATRLATRLRGAGVGPDVRVAICLDRSVEMVVGVLAVLKAGGAYVPLDPAYPEERLSHMLTDSRSALVVTGPGSPDWIGRLPIPSVDVRHAESPPTDAGPGTWSAPVNPDHLMCLIYTSGSTGGPKGVMNAHRSVVNRLAWMGETHALRVGEAVLLKSAFSFDASVFELFWPLSCGGQVVLSRPRAHQDPQGLVDTIRDGRVTSAYFVCSMLRLFLESDAAKRCHTLRRVLCGGEPFLPDLVRQCRDRLPDVVLYNLYGPSESAVSVSGAVPPTAELRSLVSLGRPAPNVHVHILDRRREPVPVGVVGELFIGGAQLARGYWDRPDLTAARFVPDAISGGHGDRLYRTGDLGRWRSDGTIEFLGRIDDQLKIRGFRVEPAEVESRLDAHPSVRESAVVVRDEAPGDQRLVAYWVGDATEDARSLREFLTLSLPEHMIPAVYVRIDTIPRTPSGKRDLRALPSPSGEALPARPYEAPVGDTQVTIAGIWSEVLGVTDVGRHAHFFELGGHSLLAIRVVERMRKEGLHTEVITLFATPTLAELAESVRDGEDTAPPSGIPVVPLVQDSGDAEDGRKEWRL
jgi:amino acid adenylation domain-containing protein